MDQLSKRIEYERLQEKDINFNMICRKMTLLTVETQIVPADWLRV